jgi:hypothetical protein
MTQSSLTTHDAETRLSQHGLLAPLGPHFLRFQVPSCYPYLYSQNHCRNASTHQVLLKTLHFPAEHRGLQRHSRRLAKTFASFSSQSMPHGMPQITRRCSCLCACMKYDSSAHIYSDRDCLLSTALSPHSVVEQRFAATRSPGPFELCGLTSCIISDRAPRSP